MNKNEQDMIRKIKEKSEQVPVPKALEPRQIEAKLAGKKKKVWTPARISGLAAACLVLIVGVMVYQNYFKMEDSARDDKIAGSDVTISDSTKVESAAEYKDVYAYLEKYKKDQERDSAYTSSGARSLNDIRVDESADSKASGDAHRIWKKAVLQQRTSEWQAVLILRQMYVRKVWTRGIQLKQMEHTFTC